MCHESVWLDSVSANEEEHILSNDFCSDEIFYVDLSVHEELLTEEVTNLTSRTK
jgi:hypothetical protein